MSESASTPEGLWTAEDVAGYLQVSEGTVNQWVKFGKIPHVKVGRLNRFRPTEIKAWVESNARPAEAV